MKNTLKNLFALAMAAAGTSTYAASGVIELEIPGMNEETAARIVDFRTNACPATVAALRDSIASNYDGVVLRKADKRDELQVFPSSSLPFHKFTASDPMGLPSQ